MKRARTAILVSTLAALLAGCGGVGARRIRAERFDYNEAVVQTWNEQMLLNLVRLRYRDTPYFLEVTSVSTQYEVAGTVGAGATLDVAGGSGNEYTLGANAGYVERPTVTYAPLAGEDFVQRLLSPIPMESLLLLTASGWRADRVLRCAVARINDVPNAPRATGPTPDEPPDYEAFDEVAGLIWRLQKKRVIEVLEEGPELQVRIFAGRATGDAGPALERLQARLGLPAGRDRFRLVSARRNVGEEDLVIIPRSLIGVMFYLSQAVEPPEHDREAGRVTITRGADGAEFDWAEMMHGLFHVHSSQDEPQGVFVRVRYRGVWFYIDDADLTSKSTFGLLAQLFNLQAGDARGGGPLLTLPVGR